MIVIVTRSVAEERVTARGAKLKFRCIGSRQDSPVSALRSRFSSSSQFNSRAFLMITSPWSNAGGGSSNVSLSGVERGVLRAPASKARGRTHSGGETRVAQVQAEGRRDSSDLRSVALRCKLVRFRARCADELAEFGELPYGIQVMIAINQIQAKSLIQGSFQQAQGFPMVVGHWREVRA